MSVDLRVNRNSAISGHMHRLEARRIRHGGASGTNASACLPNDAYAQRWRLIRQTLIYLQPLDWSQVDYEKLAAFDIYEYKGNFQRVSLVFYIISDYFGAYLTDVEV